jgi:hypothetical protein
MDVEAACIICNWYDALLWPILGLAALASTAAAGWGNLAADAYDSYAGDPGPPPPPAAAPDTGVTLNDLFGETDRFTGVGDTTNPTYSDTSADDRIAADEAEQQRINEYWKNTHPGATTAGPPEPTTGDVVKETVFDAFWTLGKRER